MNFLLKLKPLVLLSSVFFISCDSDTPLVFGGSVVTDVTEADDTVSTDELFEFVNTEFPENGQSGDLRVVSDNILSDGSTYVRSGLFTATIERQIDTATDLQQAVQLTFSINTASNVEARTLLLVEDVDDDDPNLTLAETARLVELLNVNGAGLDLVPNSNVIVGSSFTRYTLTVTSTLQERISGIVSGTYGFERTELTLSYQRESFSDDEGNSFQFFLPVFAGTASDLILDQQGTFTLQLVNEAGF